MMLRMISRVISSVLLIFGFNFMLTITVVAQEVTQPPTSLNQSIADAVCQGILGTQKVDTADSTKASDCKEEGNDAFLGAVRRIINIFSVVVGAVSVIMIIIGGFRYIISGGDSSGVSGAKNTILYAIVGLVVVLFSQALVRFVVSNLTNTTNPQPVTNTSQTK